MRIQPMILVLLLSLCGTSYAYEERAPPGIDLSGRWVLNPKLSDDADALLRQRLEKQLKRERGWREEEARENRGVVEPPVQADSEAESLSRRQLSRVLVQLRRTLELYSVVEINQSAAGAQLDLNGDGNQRRVSTGNSAMSMPEGQLADAEVGWDGDELVIDRNVRRGPRMVERYRFLKKTGQLQVVITWRGQADDLLSGVKVKRVFDRREGPEAAPNPDVGPVR